MRNARSPAFTRKAKHADFAHAGRLVPGKQRSDSTIKLDSSSATQRDDGQVLAPRAVADREFETLTTSPVNLRMRSCAWRSARPSTSWFESRREACGWSAKVDLVRGSHLESGVRSVSVVPGDEEQQLAPDRVTLVGNQHASGALVLHGADEPLDHGDAPILADRAESLLDAVTETPATERDVGELGILGP